MNGHREVVPINGMDLTLDKVVAVADGNAEARVPEEKMKELAEIRKDFNGYLEQIFDWDDKTSKDTPGYKLKQKQKMMYGVTTGFGKHKTHIIQDPKLLDELQLNLVHSHACGVGDDFDAKTTRAIMTLRINTLASGYCGISPGVVEQLEKFLKFDIRPCIPQQGSVGASGDLAPLAHLALGLIGKGPVKYRKGAELVADLKKLKDKHPELDPELDIARDTKFDTLSELKKAHPELDINPDLQLAAKDGLALINGLAVTTAISVLAHADAENLLEWADVIGAVTLESMLGSSRAFDQIAVTTPVYHHLGAGESARRIRKMITGSKLINRSSHVHDAYSIRCIPQVHGAVRDALNFIRTTLQNQINSVDDDPIIFGEQAVDACKPLDYEEPPEGTDADQWLERRHFEQGNFHGEPVAFAMDLLAIVVAELGSISERRTQMLLDENHNRELPSCLVQNPDGVNSGYMIAQYTAAALASENKSLSHPASVDSIPTSANTEDHVSMGPIAARKARRVIENVKNILAIELICASEALSYRVEKEKCWQDPEVVDKETKKKKNLPEVKGDCGERTAELYNAVKNTIGFLEGKDVIRLEGKDVFLYERLAAVREKFLDGSPGGFVGDLRSEETPS